ncbi:NADP-dependent oxidoreductase domain-containing protein [Kockovaella imperatae]|uniref:NADP-dependent oxidoreductase domain-containing protein n=1 Tax=Kockovaella imperatae TaxID=4999 RepID=A0A1Y1URI9_9TREE|nr:NADP-dependent oxidoreductase domain-containing protein [Kockovaella imperatae]ORX40552.1 NADP-dependent oxidoreductase domain-containing protein [Kockovaella imperatae]
MWESRTLNDGSSIPGIAFGTAYTCKEELGPRIENALKAGFRHFDTAQGKAYDNERELGEILSQSGIPRSELFISTKWSNPTSSTPLQACRASLKLLGVDYVDLFLIHQPRNCAGDIPGTWKLMEEIKQMGLARSIGVSNFKVDDLETLLESCTVPPAVNQIYFSPNNYASSKPLLDLAQQHDVQIEGYWTLRPLADDNPQPVVRVAHDIAQKLKCQSEQVLLAWAGAKNVLAVTRTARAERMQSYLGASEVKLDPDDITDLDAAGAKASPDSELP